MSTIRLVVAIWTVALLAVLVSGFGGTELWAESLFAVSISLLAAALLGRLYRTGLSHQEFSVSTAVLGCIALIGGGQLAFGASVYPYATTLETVRWVALAALAFTTADVAADTRARRVLIDALYGLGVLICFFGLLHFYTCGGRLLWSMTTEFGPTFAPFINRDHYAAFCELILPFALFAAICRRRHNLFHAAVAAILIAAIVASGSRMGVLIAVAELLAMLFLQRLRLVTSFPLAVVVASIAVLGILFATIAGPDVLIRKMRAPAEWQYRLMMAGSAWKMGLERPVTGHGLGTFEVAYPRFAQFDLGLRIDHAHNDWLEWFAEGGIVVPFCVALFAASVLRRIQDRPWLIGVPAVLVHGLVDFPWRIPAIAAYAVAIASAGQPFRFAASSKTPVKKSRDVGEQPMCKVPLLGDSSTNPR